jgi:multicomponent Na+:H+ antiporter subunit D
MTALIPLVVMLPLIGAAGALIAGKRQRLQVIVTIVALVAVLVVSVVLLIDVDATGALVMEVGGWAAPVGIVLVVDRLERR